jgi:predicted nucleic acid-binding Zn ribbon protein
MNCLNCSILTTNPKFCSRSCAAIFNNSRKDIKRRTVEGSCFICQTPIPSSRRYCKEHRTIILSLDATKNSNDGKNAYIRSHSRALYRKSQRPYVCCLCEYSKHVDICHVKDIRSYPDGTSYLIINHPSNIIALCKNHHWEFDHDML